LLNQFVTFIHRANRVKIYDLIFSRQGSHRLCRHLIFWLVFLLYFFYVNLIPATPEDLWHGKTYWNAFELMIYFPVSVISVYTAIYFLLPRYIVREKYFSLMVVITGLTVIYFSLAWLLTMLLAKLTTNIPFEQLPVSFKWFQPIRYGIGLPLTSAVLTTIIKLLKNMHLEQKENEFLQRQKINTDMQLIKAQFQPGFLYDALQHIFYLINKNSSQSPSTVLKLSDLLSYVLYDNEKENVPLEKELQIIKTYLSLKKIFYPERLNVQIKQEGSTTGVIIPPILLLSLVENCFEEFLDRSTRLIMDLDIKIENGELYFFLECRNNIESEITDSNKNYQWVRSLKRIEILYPGKHSFDIYSENGITSLTLVLQTNKILTAIQKEEFVL
jgi:two-component system LytT family sensor kinase